MLRKFGSHLRDQWMGALSLFLVLGGGTAWAVDGPLAGQNTVGSEDIINDDILSKDIADGRIFNVDLADNLITGQKIKDNTLDGFDLADEIVLGDQPTDRDSGSVYLTTNDGFTNNKGAVRASAIKSLGGGARGFETVSMNPFVSRFNYLQNAGAMTLANEGSSNDFFNLGLDDPGVIFERATTTPTLSSEQSFVYMRRSSSTGPLEMVVKWPNGERDVIATYNTE